MYRYVIFKKANDFPGGYYYIDLDKTLAFHKTEWGAKVIGKPLPKMVVKIKKLLRDGKKIKIFTARAGEKKAIKEIQDWLKANRLPRFEITNIKGTDVIEIWDDRARQVDPNTGEFAKALGHAMGKEERKRLRKEKADEKKEEREEDIKVYGVALDEPKKKREKGER